MSQYGILLDEGLNLPTGLTSETSGITFTINPLATPGVKCQDWVCNDPYFTTGTGAGNYGLFSADIDPYVAMVTHTPSISTWEDLLAGTPIFWVLHISEISNPRLKAYFASNLSGIGRDIKFELVGENTGTTNSNMSRTSDSEFLNIDDPYFSTANASPFTNGTLINSYGMAGLAGLPNTFADALNPYGFLNDGVGNPTSLTSFDSTTTTRNRNNTFVTKEPTLSFVEPTAGVLTTNKNKESSFSLHISVYTSASGWHTHAHIEKVVGYRSSEVYTNMEGVNWMTFPTNVQTGAYVDFSGYTAYEALVFNWYTPNSGIIGKNMEKASWQNAFSTTPPTSIDGTPVYRGNGGVTVGDTSSYIGAVRTEDLLPSRWLGLTEQHDMSCGLYWNLYTLTTGVGKNFSNYIDDESSSLKSIFGYYSGQGAPDIDFTACNHTTSTFPNGTSTTNAMRHMDHREFWYAFSTLPSTTSGLCDTGSKEPVPVSPSSFVTSIPMCGDDTDWQTKIIDLEYVPAPIDDTNIDMVIHTRVQAGNTWLVPTGVEKVEAIFGPSYAAGTTYVIDTNWTSIPMQTRNNNAPNSCPYYNLSFLEPKSVCMITKKIQTVSAAMDLGDWNITIQDATCTADGKLTLDVDWTAPCTGAFYDTAPDDYSFNILCHFSKNNTGVITDTITIVVTNVEMNFNPITGVGAPSGNVSGSVVVPCGDYYHHSMQVTPMTSTMYTQAGQGHTWTPGNGGTTWAGFANTNNHVACGNAGGVISSTSTNASCGTLGSITLNISGATGPYNYEIVDSAGVSTSALGTALTTYTFSSLNADTYAAQITDSAGCVYTDSIIITGGSTPMTVTASVTTPTHCILSNGSINLSVSGGVAPYIVAWTDSNGSISVYTGLSANPLPAGVFGYTVTDSAGCISATGSATVPSAPSLGLACSPMTNYLNPSGPGLSDGIINVAINNSSGTFVNGAQSLNNLYVTVADSNGVIVIGNSTSVPWYNLYATSTGTGVNVPGLSAGTYTITATINPNIIQSNAVVIQASACTLTCTVTLTDPSSGAAATVGTIVGNNCAPGPNTGTIAVSAAGGSTSIFHHWDFTLCTDAGMSIGCQTFTGTSTFGDNTTGNTHTFTALAAGTYYATVTPCFGVNGASCLTASATTSIITVPQISGPSFTISQVNPSCALGCDGSYSPNPSGGTPPYNYQYWHTTNMVWAPAIPGPWSSFVTTGHCAANIQNELFQVVDALGCTASDTVTLVDPPALDFTQAPFFPQKLASTCGASTGVVTFTPATGGTITAPDTTLQYDLIDSGGIILQTMGPNGGTNQFSGLASGPYTIDVTDSNGCTQTISFTILEVSFTLSTIKSDQGCNFPPSSDGSIQVLVAPYANVPVPNYTHTWTGPGGYTFTETIAGVTGTLQTGLAVGTYTIAVVDGNGCTTTIVETIIASADTAENLAIAEVPMSCPTGCGELNFTNTTGDFPLWLEISSDGGATWIKVSTTANSAATAFTSADLSLPLGVQIDNFTYYQENTSNRFCFNMGSTYHARTRGSSSPYCPSVIVPITMSTTAYVAMVHTETIQQPTCCSCNSVACNGSIENIISNGVPIPQGVVGTLMSFDWTLTLDGINIGTQTGSSFTGGVSYTVSSTQGSPTVEEFDTVLFTGLYPGTYVFTSTDSCNQSVSETWTITDPRVYITNIITSQPLCAFGCDDGIITVHATGGSSGTYQYSYDDGVTWSSVTPSTFYIFGSIGQGTWNIWVRDPICGTQTLFDVSDNVLTTDPGCYSDFIPGIWPAGTQTTLAPVSDLNTQWVSLTNNSLPGSSDGAIEVNILGGTAPYEVAVSTSSTHQACNLCALQGSGVIVPGLSQYINVNGANVSNTGVTTVTANGSLIIDNLSVSLDFNLTALGAWYTIIVKDATGCFSCISKYIDNGTLGIIAIYSAEDCNCSCPTGYALIDPVPVAPALPCAGTTPSAPTFIGAFNAPSSIQQFGAANVTFPGYGSSGGRLYIPTGGTSGSFSAVSTGDTFTKTDLGATVGFPGQFVSSGSGTVLEVALDGAGLPQSYGTIFDSRLWDIGTWPQQGPTSPALPTNEWIGIPIEVSFGSSQLCILGFAADGDYKITLNCGTFLTSEFSLNGGTQTVQVDNLNYEEYVMMPILIPAGDHTLTFWVKNNTTNASADQVAGIAFDLFQGNLSSGLSVTSVFVGANTQAQLDPYYILDVYGKKITSRNLTASTFEHDFLMGDTNGFNCPSGCTIMSMGNITCLSDDTADCTLPINCPEFLSDLVECVGTLSNEVYDKMITGLLENKLDVREVWLVLLIKYLIKNLNPCISMQDLLSWTKFLEDICPDCENTFEGTKAVIVPSVTPPANNTFDF